MYTCHVGLNLCCASSSSFLEQTDIDGLNVCHCEQPQGASTLGAKKNQQTATQSFAFSRSATYALLQHY